jgi:predicted RNA-binding protein
MGGEDVVFLEVGGAGVDWHDMRKSNRRISSRS